jgi:hypothetical protein
MQEYRTYYYEEGSLAHKVEITEAPSREERIRERERQEKEKRQRIAKNRKKQLRALRRQALSFSLAVVIIAGLFAGYVHLTTNIGKSKKNINDLKEQITVLKADNSAMKNRIATSLNLNSIKEKAMTELGMVYADTDQIVYYNMPDDDYMNQIEPVK